MLLCEGIQQTNGALSSTEAGVIAVDRIEGLLKSHRKASATVTKVTLSRQAGGYF